MPLAECSDSSDNSSSLVTNLSMEKMHNLEKDVESSDNSDDEYIPLGKFYEWLFVDVYEEEQNCKILSLAACFGTR